MTLTLLCQFTAQHISDVNTSIFRSLRLFGALLCRLYCAVMIEFYVLVYLVVSAINILCVMCVALSECVAASVWCPVVLEHFVCGVLHICIDVYMHELHSDTTSPTANPAT